MKLGVMPHLSAAASSGGERSLVPRGRGGGAGDEIGKGMSTRESATGLGALMGGGGGSRAVN